MDLKIKNMEYNKENYKIAAQNANVPKNEVDFRFSAFEAMSLAIHGNHEEAKEKLKEMDNYYNQLNNNQTKSIKKESIFNKLCFWK